MDQLYEHADLCGLWDDAGTGSQRSGRIFPVPEKAAWKKCHYGAFGVHYVFWRGADPHLSCN